VAFTFRSPKQKSLIEQSVADQKPKSEQSSSSKITMMVRYTQAEFFTDESTTNKH
jgi:hypothetical protein